MSHGFPESDWKLFRKLREVALERLCEQILNEASSFSSGDAGTAHERYLKLYSHVEDRNSDVARAFDNPRRSSMLIQLATMCSLDLLRPEELDRFSVETRETAESLGKRR